MLLIAWYVPFASCCMVAVWTRTVGCFPATFLLRDHDYRTLRMAELVSLLLPGTAAIVIAACCGFSGIIKLAVCSTAFLIGETKSSVDFLECR